MRAAALLLAALRFALPFGVRVALACGVLACAACTGARPGDAGPGAEGRAVVRTAQALFDAMEARDTTALRRLLHPEAQVIGVGPGGRVRAQTDGIEAWIRDVGGSEDVLRERMRTPRVEVAGDLATLWAPYDFHLGERFSHCGTDAFQFVRDGAAWRLLVVTFTVETEGCAAGGAAP